MALTLATELADYASGIGTQGATLKIDADNKRVGVGTTNPQGPEGTLQVGTGITFFGNTGIVSAIGGKFSGDFTVGGTLTYEDVQNVNSSGIVTAQTGVRIVGGGLTVTGVSTFFSRVSIADSIVHTGDINTSLRFPAADTFTVETAGSERIRVSAAGSFGIGTNDPTESLHIDGNLRMGATADSGNFTDSRSTTTRALTIGAAGDALLVTHSSGQGLGFFGYEAGGDRLVIACDGGSGGNKIDFITDAGTSNDADNLNGKVPKMRIDATGQVSINKTSNVSAKLHIGDTSNDGALSQLIKLGNDSSGSGTGSQINLGSGNGVESTAACISGFYDGTGTVFAVKTAGTLSDQGTVAERLRIGRLGQIGIAGANYGSSGQVLTSKGSGASVAWEDPQGGDSLDVTASLFI